MDERSLEASSLYLAAEILERNVYATFHPAHLRRIRAVASRISIDLEEAKLRRSIEGEFYDRELADVAGLDRATLTNLERCDDLPARPSDMTTMRSYLEAH